ncbi:glycosyltransferase family 4 protein [Vibrio brasiliensis]|uniref:glycosyltransferase family 4 protein n=1 Tax=Vibrio brasiliensis TaxID=170652 RepID=UPI001EFDE237|nr:glycosyltransferase family 4 protein [Vibrio brasiliensis]MCG9648329.1 glycosyltransferase family 4 protein [Vibrio brasiliensis]
MARKILFVHYGDNWIRGSEQCLLDLIHYIGQRNYQPVVWTNNRTLAELLDQNQVTTELSQFKLLLGWQAPRFNLMSWAGLVEHGCELIERENIELIHINSGAPCQWMIAAARIKNVPLVTQLHCPYQTRDRLTLGLHLSPHIISVSHHVSQALIKDGYPQSRVSVVHNGIDTQSLIEQQTVDVRGELNISDQDFIFATVGSLIHRKGIDRLLTALRHVTLEYPNVHLVVIGDGPLKRKLKNQAEYLHLADQIHFVGEQHNVIGWLKGCDAFVSGARSEAFGLVVAEAGLAKLPIVAPFEGGIPEFISHGKTGVLYPNKGIGPIANAMRILINNPKLCRILAVKAYQHITRNHDLSVTCPQIEKVYQQILAQKQNKPRSLFSTLLPIKSYLANRVSLGGQHG